MITSSFVSLTCAHLGPLGVDDLRFDGIVQGRGVLAQTQVGRRAVAVQDTVLGVRAQGLAVETHGQGELPLLAGLVAAPHALQELSLAQASGAGRPLGSGPPPAGRRGNR